MRLTHLKTIRAGMTLAESLVALVIIGIIFTTVANVFVASNQFTKDEQQRIAVGDEAVRLFSTVDSTLRQAKNVITDPTVINGVSYTSGSTELVFSLPSVQNNGSLSPTENDTGVLALDTSQSGNAKLRLIISPDITSTRDAIDQYAVENVKDLYFRYNTPTLTTATSAVTLTLTVERTANDKPYRHVNVLYATFRNHP